MSQLEEVTVDFSREIYCAFKNYRNGLLDGESTLDERLIMADINLGHVTNKLSYNFRSEIQVAKGFNDMESNSKIRDSIDVTAYLDLLIKITCVHENDISFIGKDISADPSRKVHYSENISSCCLAYLKKRKSKMHEDLILVLIKEKFNIAFIGIGTFSKVFNVLE